VATGALAGVKVIELAGMGPTPFCGMLLADMGADVLRIDRVSAIEVGAGLDDRTDLRGRNKRSARIDLKHPVGRAALIRLVECADVLLEGYRPGVAERMGIGPEVARVVNPRLVYGRATGWGRDGPMSQAAGHDINYIALAGALDMIGVAGGAPVPPLNLVGDYGGGALYLAFGVVCALFEARGSGRGQVVDAAMIDGVASLLTVFHGMRQAGQGLAPRGQNVLDGGAPWYSTYETKDGLWMAVGAIEERFFGEFLKGLGLDPSGLPDRGNRVRWPELREKFASRFREKTRAEWETQFEGLDACVSPVLGLAESGAHPHNRARGMLVEVDGQDHPSPAPRMGRTPGDIRRPPVRAGQHTIEALRDWGLSAHDVAVGLSDGYFAGL
jgi:alpha-methylacyl-CoA racemase